MDLSARVDYDPKDTERSGPLFRVMSFDSLIRDWNNDYFVSLIQQRQDELFDYDPNSTLLKDSTFQIVRLSQLVDDVKSYQCMTNKHLFNRTQILSEVLINLKDVSSSLMNDYLETTATRYNDQFVKLLSYNNFYSHLKDFVRANPWFYSIAFSAIMDRMEPWYARWLESAYNLFGSTTRPNARRIAINHVVLDDEC